MLPVYVSLPRWSLCYSDCQHPYFSCGLRGENFNGSVVTQAGADQCLWVWPHITAKQTKEGNTSKIKAVLHRLQWLGIPVPCWVQCSAWGWRQPCCDQGGSTAARLQPHGVLQVAWSSSGTTGCCFLVRDWGGLPVDLQPEYAIINQRTFPWLMQSTIMHWNSKYKVLKC